MAAMKLSRPICEASTAPAVASSRPARDRAATDWDRHYARYSRRFAMRLTWTALRARSPARRRALLNRQRDYLALASDPARLALHRALNACLEREAAAWQSYAYGEGYFYQGLRAIGVTGLRDTETRVAAIDLRTRLASRRVLNIGCNSGFVDLAIADVAGAVVGFDPNPYMIDAARIAAEALDVRNVEFLVSSFEDFEVAGAFDAVLSFANHSTYDGNTRQTLEAYFDRCHDVLAPGGLLLFESHPPAHEGDQLETVCGLIDERFEIEERRILDRGTYLDRHRTFVAARRRPEPRPPAGRHQGSIPC